MTSAVSICVIPGDGIGPEVTRSACRVLASLEDVLGGPVFRFDERPAGHGAYLASGESLPAETVKAAERADGVLLGAMDVARLPTEVVQPLQGLRKRLNLCASLRRARPLGQEADGDRMDVLVVREITQGFYSGIEYKVDSDSACAVRVITRDATARAARLAFEAARQRRGKVTAVHKLGALRVTESVFLGAVREVAEQFPDVTCDTKNVDACALELIKGPQHFDVIFASNAFGDILSDVAAAVGGGIGIMPSACLGEASAYFEPVHGSAPDIAGKGVANPLAAIMSAAWLLRHLTMSELADAVDAAVEEVVRDASTLTPDLGGSASTTEVTDAVISAISRASICSQSS